MNQQLSLLVELGKLESRLDETRADRDLIPRRREELQADLGRLREEIAAKETELDSLRRSRRFAEQDLEGEREKLSRYKVQLFQIKTNKEYRAMEEEIQAGEKRVSELEDQILGMMEKEDELGSAIDELKGRYQERVKEVEARNRELDAEEVDLSGRIERDERAIAELVGRIDSSVLKEYQRIRNGKQNHRAIVPLTSKGVCGGCYSIIPLQTIAEIKKGDRIIVCAHCGRILYYTQVETVKAGDQAH